MFFKKILNETPLQSGLCQPLFSLSFFFLLVNVSSIKAALTADQSQDEYHFFFFLKGAEKYSRVLMMGESSCHHKT